MREARGLGQRQNFGLPHRVFRDFEPVEETMGLHDRAPLQRLPTGFHQADIGKLEPEDGRSCKFMAFDQRGCAFTFRLVEDQRDDGGSINDQQRSFGRGPPE